MATRRRSLSRGITVLEIVIGFAILSLAVVSLMQAFMGANRQAREAENQLGEAMVAHLLVERLRDRVDVNDYALAFTGDDGKASWWGRIVAAPAGTPSEIPLNPLCEYLFCVEKAELFDPSNERSLNLDDEHSPLHGLAWGLRDFACRVSLENLAVPGEDGKPRGDGLAALLRKVVVEVHRLDGEGKLKTGREPYRLETRMLSPVASVSDPCYLAMEKGYEVDDEEERGRIRRLLGEVPGFGALSELGRETAVDAILVLGRINGEAYLAEGAGGLAQGRVIEGLSSLNGLAETLRAGGSVGERLVLCRCFERRALLLLSQFRGLQVPLERLGHRLAGGDRAEAQRVLNVFLEHEPYRRILMRLRSYPDRFAGNLVLLLETVRGLLGANLVPHDRVRLRKKSMEVMKAALLFGRSVTWKADPTAPLTRAYERTFRAFALHFRDEEIKDRPRLDRRYARYVATADRMGRLIRSPWVDEIFKACKDRGIEAGDGDPPPNLAAAVTRGATIE